MFQVASMSVRRLPLVLRRAATFGALTFAASIAGCGPGAGHIHPVSGKFVVENGGDVSSLAGHIVETRLESDPLVRSSGQIADDGSFRLETLHQGEIVDGAAAGTHTVRIVLSDDDRENAARDAKRLGPEHRDFDKSVWKIEVPTTSDPQLSVRLK
jgi:hypothetical protein